MDEKILGRLTHEQMATALNCAGESIVITDKEGRIEYANNSFEILSGYSWKELISRKPSLWRSDRHSVAFYEDLWDCITSGGIWHGEVTNRKKDGSLYDCLLTIAPIWGKSRTISGFVSTISDVTGYKNLQSKLRHAYEQVQQESKARSRNLAFISHDIRTPLNGLLGLMAELEDPMSSEARLECLATMKRAGQSILALINNILDESALEARKLQLDSVAFDVRDVLRDIGKLLAPLAAQAKTSLHFHMPDELNPVLGDPNRLSRVMQNLVGNAIKFTERGEIHIRLEVVSEAQGEMMMQLQVQDNGIGIPEHSLPHIFEDYTQADHTISRNYGGSGLGLTISRKFVELMGGSIQVTSGLNRGTTFTINLPFKTTPSFKQQDSIQTPESDESPFAGKIALVCDDDEISRRILQRLLEKQKMIVHLAHNGEEGLKRIAQASYDIIFTDLQMPLMSGVSMTRQVRDMETHGGKRLPVIAITGVQLQQWEPGLFDECLLKPINHQSIPRALRRFLPLR